MFITLPTSYDGIIPGLQASRVVLALPVLYFTAYLFLSFLFILPFFFYIFSLFFSLFFPYNIPSLQHVVDFDV